jgi:L-lactate dehydrogenase (cytochrome)
MCRFALGPVGATGTYARRGEVQAARAASAAGVPYTLSTVSVCSIEEVVRGADGQLWSAKALLRAGTSPAATALDVGFSIKVS